MSDKPQATNCGGCRHLIVPPNAAGRRVVRKDKAYACGYVVNWPLLPKSITDAFGYAIYSTSYVCREYGAGCPVWEAK